MEKEVDNKLAFLDVLVNNDSKQEFERYLKK